MARGGARAHAASIISGKTMIMRGDDRTTPWAGGVCLGREAASQNELLRQQHRVQGAARPMSGSRLFHA